MQTLKLGAILFDREWRQAASDGFITRQLARINSDPGKAFKSEYFNPRGVLRSARGMGIAFALPARQPHQDQERLVSEDDFNGIGDRRRSETSPQPHARVRLILRHEGQK
jgi:hypothetical protein